MAQKLHFLFLFQLMDLFRKIQSLRGEIAQAAQVIIDDWIQDEDDEYGGGGVCDAIAMEMASIIASNIDGIEIIDGGHEGDDHAWLIVTNNDEAVGVDIPSSTYETGSGYSWSKIEGAKVDAHDVVIWKINRRDVVASRVAGYDPDDLRLQPGPAFHLQPDGTWTVEEVPSVVAQKARFSGFLTINGYSCIVFELGGQEWAQKAIGNIQKEKLSAIASRIAHRYLTSIDK